MVLERAVVGDDTMIYWIDLSMVMITGKEKTAEEFRMILDTAGFELVKIWPYAFGCQAIVEARLKRNV